MTFARKIFIAVFLSTFVVGSILIWASYRYTIDNSEKDFVSRYKIFTNVLADTLRRLDENTETLMKNAARVIVERDSRKEMLSTNELRQLQGELGITHLFLVNNKGAFVRSTNEDPATIPNLFSFCGDYKKLITGDLNVEATPIIKPSPEPRPFKFLSVPNRDRSRIIEVGVRVDFIAKALGEASASDQNIDSMSLYSPDGTPFGTFSDEKVSFAGSKVNLPSDFGNPVWSGSFVSFFTRVASSHPKCCECDISGTSKDGEYYYVLESRVSKSELKRIEARAGWIFLMVGITNLLLSFILARTLSRRLVRNIEIAVRKIRKIKSGENLSRRIDLKTGDEISILTEEVDRLLDVRESTHEKLIHAEKVASKVELARVVAHNIRSPILAIEMMIPSFGGAPEGMSKVLNNAVKEIKELSEKLKVQSDLNSNELTIQMNTELVFLPTLLDELIRQKRLEYSSCVGTKISLSTVDKCEMPYVRINSLELKSILSNLINNAVESYQGVDREVAIILSGDENFWSIKIMDRGAGIPSELLPDLGRKRLSRKEGEGRGVGLTHAFSAIAAFGGKIEITSQIGQGTTVEILLQKFGYSNGDLTRRQVFIRSI